MDQTQSFTYINVQKLSSSKCIILCIFRDPWINQEWTISTTQVLHWAPVNCSVAYLKLLVSYLDLEAPFVAKNQYLISHVHSLLIWCNSNKYKGHSSLLSFLAVDKLTHSASGVEDPHVNEFWEEHIHLNWKPSQHV